MGQMWTIARRETIALCYSPISYAVVSCFFFVIALIFTAFIFHSQEQSDLKIVFWVARFVLLLATPLLTMSLFSEEFKSGRIEMLRTSPIRPSALVMGKYIGGLLFYIAMLGSLLLFVLVLTIWGGPDYWTLLASFLGLLLVGLLYVSVGLFFSACTQSQLLAAIGAILTLGALNLVGDFASWFSEIVHLKPWLRTAIIQTTVGSHFEDFAKGTVDVGNIVYFVTTAFFFIFLTYLVMESRNWRR